MQSKVSVLLCYASNSLRKVSIFTLLRKVNAILLVNNHYSSIDYELCNGHTTIIMSTGHK